MANIKELYEIEKAKVEKILDLIKDAVKDGDVEKARSLYADLCNKFDYIKTHPPAEIVIKDINGSKVVTKPKEDQKLFWKYQYGLWERKVKEAKKLLQEKRMI